MNRVMGSRSVRLSLGAEIRRGVRGRRGQNDTSAPVSTHDQDAPFQ
jgi:hypothetical protein